MPEWLTDLITVSPWLVALCVGLGLLARIWPHARKLSHFIDDVVGEPARPGVPSRPGLVERIARIEHEVTPNHGSSMKDSLARLETRLESVEDRMRLVDALHDRWGDRPDRRKEHP